MKILSVFLGVVMLLAFATLAIAAPTGKLVKDPNGHAIQTPSPYPPGSACTTTTTTKGAIHTLSSVAGYSQLCYDAADSNKAAKRVLRHLNGNTAGMPVTSGCIALNKDITSVAFKPYSGASAAYTVCTELTRGGETP